MSGTSYGLAAEPKSADSTTPLVFDLDGTLIATDLLVECMLQYLRLRPLGIFQLATWLFQGRAVLKRKLAEAVQLDIATLPIREEVVAYGVAAARERQVYIATAADEVLASRLLERFGFVTGLLGSDGVVNLSSAQKAKALVERFPQGFAYVGDSRADLAVWRAASGIIYAGGSASLGRIVSKMDRVDLALPAPKPSLRTWLRAFRVHQWAKNALVFVPVILGGQSLSPTAWIACLLGFLGLGALASSTYVVNDLLDLESDRRHATKRNRPFASGALSIKAGLTAAPLGLICGLLLSFAAGGWGALALAGCYLAGTLSYSFKLKRVPILDTMMLGALFTLRLAMGIVCAKVAWSPWLLVFSMFIFTGLSLAKRLTELQRVKATGGDRISGRGYLLADLPMVLALGVSLASATVVVMVMYLIEEAFLAGYYRTPGLLWAFPVVLALWLGRIWLLCGRGELDDDPVVFALRDPTSLLLGALMAVSLAAAIFL